MFYKNSGPWIMGLIIVIALGEVLMFPTPAQVAKPVNTITRPRSQTPRDQALPSQAIIRLANTKLPHPITKGQGNLPLQALSGGLSWTLTVKTGEHSGQFLLDTGASISIITAAWTKLLGLTGTPIPRENTRYAVAGNACREMDTALYRLPPLILDRAEVKGLQALQLSQSMVPEGVMGILGMDVLSRFHFRLDPARRELQLMPPQPLPDGDRAIPLAMREGVALVKVRLNNSQPFLFLIDTGAESLFISPKVAAQLHLAPEAMQAVDVQGFCGLEPARYTTLKTVSLGDGPRKLGEASLNQVEAVVLQNTAVLDSLQVDGILGQNFLQAFQQEWYFNDDQMEGRLLLNR